MGCFKVFCEYSDIYCVNIKILGGCMRVGNINTYLSKAEMRHIIDNRMDYLAEKIKNGDTEISYQIGASSFTEREWNKIIEKYDDIQEKLKEMKAQEREKKEQKAVNNVKKLRL